jgi:hypothetical protein
MFFRRNERIHNFFSIVFGKNKKKERKQKKGKTLHSDWQMALLVWLSFR